MTLLETGRDGAPKNIGFVSRLDNQLENSWRERKWADFLRALVVTIVLTAAVGFVVPLIMNGLYVLISAFVFGGGKGGSGPNLLGVCAGISAMAGGTVLIFTVPVMIARAGRRNPA